MSDYDAERVELHLQHCAACQSSISDMQPEELFAFESQLKRENTSVALADDKIAAMVAVAARSMPPALSPRRTPSQVRFIMAFAAMAGLVVLAAGWVRFVDRSPPTPRIAAVEKSESNSASNATSHSQEQPPADLDNDSVTTGADVTYSNVPITVPREEAVTLLVRDGFRVVDKETEEGEIPFFWVLPSAKRGIR